MTTANKEEVQLLVDAVEALIEVGRLLDERTLLLGKELRRQSEQIATLERHNRNGYYTYKPAKEEDND